MVDVTRVPIDFGPLPRQDDNMLAEVPACQPPLAQAIDANFAKLNAWAGTQQPRIVTERVSSILNFSGEWTWYTTVGLYCDGIICGDIRFLSLLIKFNSDMVRTANSTGNLVGSQESYIGAIKDSRFWPGTHGNGIPQYLSATGGHSNGMCCASINGANGQIILTGLSYNAQTLFKGQYVYFNLTYMVRG